MNNFIKSLTGLFRPQNISICYKNLSPSEKNQVWAHLEKPDDWDSCSDIEKALFFRNHARQLFPLKEDQANANS